MNDNEKLNGFENRQEGATPQDEAEVLQPAEEVTSTPEAEALNSELEEIKDMFQRELDGQLDEEADSAVLLDGDGEAVPVEETESLPPVLCPCCGENYCVQKSENDYHYCEDCRKLLLHRPVSFAAVIAIILSVGIFAAATVGFAKNLDTYTAALSADSALSAGDKFGALNGYISYMNGVNSANAGKKVVKRAARTFAELGYYTDAYTYIDKFFTDAELKLPTYSSLNKIAHSYDVFTVTYEAINKIISEPLATADVSKIDYKALIAQLEELKNAEPVEVTVPEEVETEEPTVPMEDTTEETTEKTTEESTADTTADTTSEATQTEAAKPAEKKLVKYEPMFIEYYKYVVLATAKRPLTEQYDQLLKVKESAGENLWLYGTNLCNVAAKLGKVEETEALFNELLRFNKSDSSSYVAFANAYRFGEKPDADKVLELVSKGLEVSPSTELYRLQAIAYLMKGEFEDAYTAAMTSFNSGYSFQNIYTFAVCAILTENDEAYKSAVATLEGYGYKMSEEVLKLKSGDMKLKDLLYNAEGDLS